MKWMLVVQIFGQVALQLEPVTAAECSYQKAAALLVVQQRATSGVPYYFRGRRVRLSDIEMECVRAGQ